MEAVNLRYILLINPVISLGFHQMLYLSCPGSSTGSVLDSRYHVAPKLTGEHPSEGTGEKHNS